MTRRTAASGQNTPAGTDDNAANNDGEPDVNVAANRDATCSTSGEPTVALLCERTGDDCSSRNNPTGAAVLRSLPDGPGLRSRSTPPELTVYSSAVWNIPGNPRFSSAVTCAG